MINFIDAQVTNLKGQSITLHKLKQNYVSFEIENDMYVRNVTTGFDKLMDLSEESVRLSNHQLVVSYNKLIRGGFTDTLLNGFGLTPKFISQCEGLMKMWDLHASSGATDMAVNIEQNIAQLLRSNDKFMKRVSKVKESRRATKVEAMLVYALLFTNTSIDELTKGLRRFIPNVDLKKYFIRSTLMPSALVIDSKYVSFEDALGHLDDANGAES